LRLGQVRWNRCRCSYHCCGRRRRRFLLRPRGHCRAARWLARRRRAPRHLWRSRRAPPHWHGCVRPERLSRREGEDGRRHPANGETQG
jgi:hypothetical protein